jgi:hypothetical protein
VVDGLFPVEPGRPPRIGGSGVTVCASAEVANIPANNADKTSLYGNMGSPPECVP